MAALDAIVRSGRALYVGLSNYSSEQTRQAAAVLHQLGTPCVIHQPRYNLLERKIEQGLLQTLGDVGMGCIVFSPLAQGVLTDRYLGSAIPADSRAARGAFLRPEQLTPQRMQVVRALNGLAQARGQTLAQMAVAWVLVASAWRDVRADWGQLRIPGSGGCGRFTQCATGRRRAEAD